MSDTNTNTKKMIVFLDAIGRTIIGEQVECTCESKLAIKNPTLLHAPSDAQGRMTVQLIPLFFRELASQKDAGFTFFFHKNSVTLSDIDPLDFRLLSQYDQIHNPANSFVPPPQQTQEPDKNSVISLFDE
jgi:hypothetical protein